MRTSRKADARPAFQFYPDDWISEESLRFCDLAARGLWAECLCWMHKAERRGVIERREGLTLTQTLSALVGRPECEVDAALVQLRQHNVGEIDNDSIACRRVVREVKAKSAKSAFGKHAAQERWKMRNDGSSSSSSSSSPSSKKKDTVASPAAPPSATAAGVRDAQRAQEADALAVQLVDAATRYESGAGAVCRIYLEEAERGLAAWYEKRCKLWTSTRRRDWLQRLQRIAVSQPAAVLAALELYIDDHASGKDEAYIVGIARRLARTLETEPAAFDAEMDRHRRRNKQGALAQAMEAIDGLAQDLEPAVTAALREEAGHVH